MLPGQALSSSSADERVRTEIDRIDSELVQARISLDALRPARRHAVDAHERVTPARTRRGSPGADPGAIAPINDVLARGSTEQHPDVDRRTHRSSGLHAGGRRTRAQSAAAAARRTRPTAASAAWSPNGRPRRALNARRAATPGGHWRTCSTCRSSSPGSPPKGESGQPRLRRAASPVRPAS